MFFEANKPYTFYGTARQLHRPKRKMRQKRSYEQKYIQMIN